MTHHLSAAGPRALAASLLFSSALVGTALAQIQTTTDLVANLNGPSGNGTARVTVDYVGRTVCWELSYRLSPPASVVGIYRRSEGIGDGPVVPFIPVNPSGSSGCREDVSPGIAEQIFFNPGGFSVIVYNVAAPGWAIRGELGQP
jgi:hypothetical protein